MRGIPSSPIQCRACGVRNGCQKDALCHACRLSSRPNRRKRFEWTHGLDQLLSSAYRRSRSREELTAALDNLQRISGFTRVVIQTRAAILGLSFVRRRPWGPQEVEYLHHNVGSVTLAAMARQLGRSPASVKAQVRTLGNSLRVTEGYSAEDLASLLGVSSKTATRWIQQGWLSREAGRIPEASVARFLRAHSTEYQLARVDEAWFKGVLFPKFNASGSLEKIRNETREDSLFALPVAACSGSKAALRHDYQ